MSVAALIAAGLIGCGHAAAPPRAASSTASSARTAPVAAAAAVRAPDAPLTSCAGQPGSTAIDLAPMASVIKARIMITLGRVPEIPDGETTGAPMPATLTCDELAAITVLVVTVAVPTLAGVDNLRNLRELRLAGVDDGDLAPLRGLPLTLLALGTDVPAFEIDQATRLAITDYAPIASLVRLEQLAIRGASLPDLHLLAPLAELRELEVTRSGVTDFSALVGLTRLTTLDLRGNAIVHLEPLVGLAALETVRLGDNPVSDIAPIAGLAHLQTLDLDRTAVTDLRPALAPPELLFLLACGTPAVARDATPAQNKTVAALRKKNVAVDAHATCFNPE